MSFDFLYIVLGGFASGVFFRSFFDLGDSFSFLILFLAGVLLLFYFLKSKNSVSRTSLSKVLVLGIFVLSLGLGMLRYDFFDNNSGKGVLDHVVGDKTSFLAIIVDESDVRENNTRLKIQPMFQKSAPPKVLVTTGHYPKFEYGDEIKISGILQKPENFSTDENRQFDYISYLAKDNIHYQMYQPRIEFVSAGNGSIVKEKLFAIKKAFLREVKKVIPEPHSSLLGGLVVGAKESLGKDLQEDFRKTGLIHIVVLSGYNLTIVADSIMKVFSVFSVGLASVLGGLGIIGFAIMTGASATIVRASIMALLVMIARATGRISQMTRILFVAGFLMLLHNPSILIFDPSFQLSFMATLGLITLSPKLEKYFQFVTEKFNFRETITAVISTQIFVLPLLLYMMGDFSLVAIPVNLLVLVFVPITMLMGFLTGLIGMISTTLAIPFGYISYALLNYELKIVEIFSNLPFSSVHISHFPAWLMVLVYLTYFILLFWYKNK